MVRTCSIRNSENKRLKCDKEAAGKLNEAQFIDAMGLCYVTILGSKFTPNQIKSELIPSTPVTPKSLKDETVLSPKSTPSNESLPSRFGDNSDSVLETTYKGALAVASTYHPTLGCAEYLRSQRAELGVARIDFMLRECEIYLESCSEEMMKPLDVNEMMAIALYTYDLKEIKPDDNFYFIFNSMLRNRDPHALHIWKGYLYYLFKALQKLPDISVTTYKGATVDHNLIRSNYKKGRKIHWSGFSSTTTDLSIAKRFAAASKLLFRIEVLEGKDIQKFSFFKKEKEILLNPNINFVVTRELELEGDGFYYVNLLQMAATSSVVDFGKK